MTDSILVLEGTGKKRRGVFLQNGQPVQTFFPSLNNDEVAPESIFLGKIENFLLAAQACFVRLSGTQKGFLPFSEIPSVVSRPVSGKPLLVQVKKSPTGNKDAYLTADIALTGRTCIVLPMQTVRSISSRVEDESQRAELINRCKRLAPPGCGFLLRANAVFASDEQIIAEREELLSQWKKIQALASDRPAPCVLQDPLSPHDRFLRDTQTLPEKIVTDTPLSNSALPPVQVQISDRPFSDWQIRKLLSNADNRVHWLKSGGNIYMDFCEAMTVFDVNSAKKIKSKSKEECALDVNLEASAEIARLMRLKNISGIIIVDFIDMEKETSRQCLLAAFKKVLKEDPVKTVVHGYTSLGLMEITRKRTGNTIHRLLDLLGEEE